MIHSDVISFGEEQRKAEFGGILGSSQKQKETEKRMDFLANVKKQEEKNDMEIKKEFMPTTK